MVAPTLHLCYSLQMWPFPLGSQLVSAPVCFVENALVLAKLHKLAKEAQAAPIDRFLKIYYINLTSCRATKQLRNSEIILLPLCSIFNIRFNDLVLICWAQDAVKLIYGETEKKPAMKLFPWKQSSQIFTNIVSADSRRVPVPLILITTTPQTKKKNNKTKQKNINGKTFHLANKDKSLPTRPLVGSTELFNKFFHEVYHEGWCWSHVQLFYHFTNLEETRRKKPVNTKITPDHQHSQLWHARFLQTALPACRRSSGQRTLCLHRGWKQ